jgi:protein TonB
LHQELAELATPTPAPPTAESSSEAAPNSDAPSDAAPSSQPQMAGLDDSAPPRLLNNQPPIYPAQARAERRQGTVILRLEVSDSGNVSDVAVLISSGHTILDAAAVRAVRAWRFEPARATGRAVTWTGRLPVRFLLD